MAEGLKVGCYLPLKGRDAVVGVLMLCRRLNNLFQEDDVILLEQVATSLLPWFFFCTGFRPRLSCSAI